MEANSSNLLMQRPASIIHRKPAAVYFLQLTLLWSILAVAGCSQPSSSPQPSGKSENTNQEQTSHRLTFTKDISPILFDRCVICHRPGQAAPFSLLSYQDVEKRAEQIADVTASRFMPPWKPEPGHGTFVGERHLTESQIERIRQWVAQGSVEGELSDLSEPPQFNEGWQLGEPDLVVTMTEPYTLPTEGKDVFRNFVIPTNEPTLRYVQAVEFRPSNPKVVHHANLRVDTTSMSRRLDGQDVEPGFSGMWGEEATTTGQLVGWHPGRIPILSPPEVSWPLEKDTDLLLLLHLLPTGKPESIQFSLGLHFSDQPPTKHSIVLRLFSNSIDIPAGQHDYSIEDSFRVPVDLHVFSVRPHAHYLGKEIKGFAELPDGTTKWLIWIKDWDFNWQEEYRPSPPIFLPRGSVIQMQISYDNSADNPRNPNHPPQRVEWGPNTEDEMGVLFTQVLVDNTDDLATLEKHSQDHQLALQIASIQRQLKEDPNNASHYVNLGALLQGQGKFDQAIDYFRQALQVQPDLAAAHTNLGIMLQMQENLEEAIGHFHEAVRIEPDDAKSQANLATALRQRGNVDQAIDHYRLAIRANSNLPDAHYSLAELLRSRNQFEEATEHYREVSQLQPDRAEAHYHLGITLSASRRFSEAIEPFERAIQIRPDVADAFYLLGEALRRSGNPENAIQHYHRAIDLQGDNARFHYGLAAALTIQGQVRLALKHLVKAVKINPNWVAPLNDIAFILAVHPDDKLRNPIRAVKFAERAAKLSQHQNFSVLDTLAVSYATAGRYPEAVSTSQTAIELATKVRANEAADEIRLRLELYQKGQPYRKNFSTP